MDLRTRDAEDKKKKTKLGLSEKIGVVVFPF